jgi:anaerobic selenocysteine-containing dehydrogenase
VLRLSGDRDHPVSRGFICPKGASAPDVNDDPTRVHRPLRRVGPRGSGEWSEVTWDDALDDIAEKIRRLTREHGPETLACSFGTLHAADWGLGERFLNLFGSPNTVGQDKVCYAPNALGEALTYGWGPTMYTHPTPRITRCDVLWGCRPTASMPLLWRAVTAARKTGARLIVVDPQRTQEAELADVWLQIRPGSDVALALGLINVIVREALYDKHVVAAETVGFEDLARRAADYSPSRVEELTWVPASTVVEAARLLATSGPAIIHGSNGLCQSGGMAVQAGRALACLIAITGNVDRPGAHVLAGPPRDVVANGDAVLCDALAPEQRAKRLGGDVFPYIGAGYADVAEAVSNRWYGHRHALSWMATAHEPTLWRAIATGRPYPITALIIQCHNAAGAGANARAALEGLQSENLELLVVHDLFLNRTSSFADYLLPAAHWLEKPFYSSSYGYLGFAGDYAEASPAPVAVRHEHRSDYELWRDLGRRLGQEALWPDTVEELWNGFLGSAGLSHEELCTHNGPVVGNAARRPAGVVADTVTRTYGTPSGKIELRSSIMASWGLDPLPGYEVPEIFAVSTKYFPLVLTTGGRHIQGFHQSAQQAPAFRRKFPDPVASLHPETAAAARIANGDWLTIETPVGVVRQRACITDKLAPGVVHAERWWYPERADDPEDAFGFRATNINMCTDDSTENCDPALGSWLLRGLPCRVAPAVSDEAPARPPTRSPD